MSAAKHRPAQAAPAASVSELLKSTLSPSSALELALGVLDEINAEQEKVMCVAIAGANNAGEDAVIEANLFRVIQNLTQSCELANLLRHYIRLLAAGANVEVQT